MKLRQKAGFTLVDSIVAILILSIAVTVFALVYPGIKISKNARAKLIANSVAEKRINELKGTDFASLLVVTSQAFVDTDLNQLQNAFGVFSIALYDADGDTVPENDIKLLTVTITWQDSEQRTLTLTSLATEGGLGN